MKTFKDFLLDSSGNVAFMFAFSGVALFGGVGLAIDYIGVQDSQTELQAQVDAAVLALGKSGAVTEAERETIVLGSMVANGYNPSFGTPDIEFKADGSIRIAAAVERDVTVMGIFGKKTVRILADAESRTAKDFSVEVVMVLDTTESMDGSKMTTLKAAANDLVDTVAKFNEAEVKIGMVPFSNYVNVGMANRSQSWIDVPADWDEYYMYQPKTLVTAGSCSGPDENYIDYQDGVAVTRSRATGCTPADYENDGEAYERTREHRWHGCVGSRTSGFHLTDSHYHPHEIPGLLDVTCADPLIPLTTTYSNLSTAISNLSATNDTYMPAGVAWGRRVLSEIAPMSESDMSSDTRQMMIIMTDGMNSMKLNGNNHNGINMSGADADDEIEDANDDVLDICESSKDDDGIEIFTVAFEVDDADTKTMLQTCASSDEHYFDASSNKKLIAAFRNITARIISVRLTD